MCQPCNSCPLKTLDVLFFYDMINKARTAVNIIDPVYDLVVCSELDWLGFHHTAPGGHCSKAVTCNNARLTYCLACSCFYS